MSKEEFLKIQTCVLKVNIHCDGCKQKVKKILQKIDGVYTTKIDSEQGKVTIAGNVDPATLIKKLTKNGKHAEIWGAPKPSNNKNAANQLNNQLKNLKIDNGKGGNNKGQAPKGGGNNQPKGGGGGAQGQNPQLQQLQQMKGFQDLKIQPQFIKDMKMPFNNNPNQKPTKLNFPEDEGLSDDEFDDYDDEDDDYDYDDEDDDLEDDLDVAPSNKMKPVMGNGQGGSQMPNMMNGQLLKGVANGGTTGGNNGGNGKKGGGNVPVQMNLGGGGIDGKGGAYGGKKGGNGNNNGGNQNQGGGKSGKNGGGQPQDVKTGGGNGGQNKNGNHGNGGGGAANINNFMANGTMKGGGMNDGPHGMPNMMSMNAGGSVGPMGNMPMGPIGNLPMSQMSNLSAVHGLPAMNNGGRGGGGSAGAGAGYFQGAGPDHMAGNPLYQQQMAAMMMNQQRANGNERFQPMMYARPPPAVNYMPPYPPYPYPPPPGERADQYSMFSDENTSSCAVM